MRVIFRVDASVEIGSGHLMRCLTLAKALSPMADILFVFRFMTPALEFLLLSENYALHQLPHHVSEPVIGDLQHSHWLGTSQENDALETKYVISKAGWCDWLVIDHYALDYRFETQLREHVGKILVIDDLADRTHDCDALIDQNLYPDMDVRYFNKVPEKCLLLLGSRNCFLRQEFILARGETLPRKGKVRSILIYFGGVDIQNYTQETVEVLLSQALTEIANGQLKVNVVVGSMHPSVDNLRRICSKWGLNFYVQTRKMAKLMAESDLAIGAGGISTFERLYLRLPSILRVVAYNQQEPLRYMASLGFFKLYENRLGLEELLRKALLSDNYSPPDCVENGLPSLVKVISSGSAQLHKVSALDIRRTFYWLQDDDLRLQFQLGCRPVRAKHFLYWRKIFIDNCQRVFAIYHEGQHVGNCGLKNIDLVNAICELWIYLGNVNVRGKGVAKLSLKALQRFARQELHIRSLYLHVAKNNSTAIHLYQALGFIKLETRLTYPWENRDAYMQKMELVL